jgi:hypothetical protein
MVLQSITSIGIRLGAATAVMTNADNTNPSAAAPLLQRIEALQLHLREWPVGLTGEEMQRVVEAVWALEDQIRDFMAFHYRSDEGEAHFRERHAAALNLPGVWYEDMRKQLAELPEERARRLERRAINAARHQDR